MPITTPARRVALYQGPEGPQGPIGPAGPAGADGADGEAGGFLYDTFSNRPAAGTAGRIFVASDGGFPQFDNGAAWMNLVRGMPFAEPEDGSALTQSNFGSSSLARAKGILTLDVAPDAARQLRCAYKAVTTANPVIVAGFDVATGMTLGGTASKAATACIGGLGLFMRRADNLQVLMLFADGNNSAAPYVEFQYWNNEANGFAAAETAHALDKHFMDFGMPPLFRLRFVDADSRVYADYSPDRGQTWIQLYQTPTADHLGGDPTQIGICGYTFGASNNQKILGNIWHLAITT